MIRRAIVLAAVLALILVPATAIAAKKARPHALLAGESVTVSGPLTFDSFNDVSYTSADEFPWVKVECYPNATTIGQGPGAILLTDYLDVFRGNTTFHVGFTASWEAGGADCVAQLLHFNTTTGTFDLPPLAETTFTVTP